MAAHSHREGNAWEIPWTEEPGRLQSMGLQKSQSIYIKLITVHLEPRKYLRVFAVGSGTCQTVIWPC